ncbi:uncharacterized protein GGS22DRAFT_154292 [Annulohypoxylon maeteangense]|uniref:uncharacterized protein n=1 Tax=Annulohypoxylon maeteangense TaxID=1927788 RepID=UPI002008426A|nr:uncharacterized protein GGS22DRAFT_154292 [Annulohypoxylon maeteangense]KAI0887789.1 hypothetical protein GGS22DRAFT_154292 [Annulohypoxylon maeteangense]
MFGLGIDVLLLASAAGVLFSPVSGSFVPIHDVHLRHMLSSRDDNAQTQLFNFTGVNGISEKCIAAMQTPVSCNSDAIELLLSSQGQASGNGASAIKLTADDLNNLCTSSCADSLASMNSAVSKACSDDVLSPPQSNGTTYIPGTDAQEGSMFGGNNETTFGPALAVDLVLASYKMGCLKDSAGGKDSTAWCQLRFAQNLTQPCDDCELGAYRVQMEDTPGGYDSQLAEQYTSTVSSCGKSLTPIVTPTKTGGGYASSPTAEPNGTRSCSGTMVPVTKDTKCDDFARDNGISTEQLLSLNGLTSGCVGFPGDRKSLCVEGKCKTYTVKANDTCTTVIKSAGISAIQFLSWNPMLGTRGCNADLKRQVGHVVCVGNPLAYATPTGGDGSVTSTSTSTRTASSFDQYEDVSTIWTHDPLPTDTPTNTSTGATPWKTPTYDLATGSIPGCYYMYDNAIPNLSCLAIASRYGVEEDTWVSWNPSVQRDNGTGDGNQTSNGNNCYLDVNKRYCGLFWNPLLATPTNNTDSPYAPKPKDATEGATDKCYMWDQTPAETTDNLCEIWTKAEGITVAQLYAWNPAVGDQCQNLWLNTSYCVSADDPKPTTTTTSSAPPPTSTGVTPPGPTQSGIPDNCNKYALTQDEDGCEVFAKRNNITLEQLYKWNPVLNNNCEHFWGKEAYCIGVSD